MPWHAAGVSGHAVPILDLPSSILVGCGFAALCVFVAVPDVLVAGSRVAPDLSAVSSLSKKLQLF
jgi:hypothetical protein